MMKSFQTFNLFSFRVSEKIDIDITAGCLGGIVEDGEFVTGEMNDAEYHMKLIAEWSPGFVVQAVRKDGIVGSKITVHFQVDPIGMKRNPGFLNIAIDHHQIFPAFFLYDGDGSVFRTKSR